MYHPKKIEDQEIFNEYLSSIYSQIPTKSLLLSGQDMNTNLGVRSLKNDSIGSYGLFKKNKKGVKAVNILRLHKLFATTTFFEHRDKVTWKIFDGKNTFFQLDHWIINSLRYVKDSKVVDFKEPSDYSALLLKLKISIKKRKKIVNKNVDRIFFSKTKHFVKI